MSLTDRLPVASGASDCRRWCTGRSCPADRAMARQIARPKDAVGDAPLVVGEFVAHDSAPRFRGLGSPSAGGLNMPGQGALWSRCARKRTRYAHFELCRSWPTREIGRLADHCGQAI